MICKNHVWETLPDGSRICFECDERENDICQNRHGGNEQSEEAFEAIRKGLPRRRALCLVLIHKASPEGLTVHELANHLGTTPNAVSGRLTELKKDGRITKIGTRPTPTGSKAAVYIPTPEARQLSWLL